jgi:hypothetical protein
MQKKKKVERKTEAAEWIAEIHFAKGTVIRGKPLRPMENRKESTKQVNVQFKAAEYIPRTPKERNVTCSTCLGKGHQWWKCKNKAQCGECKKEGHTTWEHKFGKINPTRKQKMTEALNRNTRK